MNSENKTTRLSVMFKVIRILLGVFFLAVGAMKLTKLDNFIDDIARFDIFPPDWEIWVAYLGIGCELVVGFCFLFRILYESAVWLAAGMCCVFVAIFIQGWMRGLPLVCNCLGVERAVQNYPFEIGWRLLLLLAVLSLLWEIRRNNSFSFVFGRLGLDRDI